MPTAPVTFPGSPACTDRTSGQQTCGPSEGLPLSSKGSTTGEAPAPQKKLPLRLIVAAFVVAGLIFAVDILTPRGLSVSTLYVVPVFLVQRATSTRLTAITALFCAILAGVGLIFSPDAGVPADIVGTDYAIMLVALTLITGLAILANRRSLQIQAVTKLLTMCAWTKSVKVDGAWISIEEYLRKHSGVTVTHGINQETARQLLAQLKRNPTSDSGN